ncbi:phosphoesterase [Candidatus Woesearchaeota archaeon]|nr:phosphoesterase [Candidatus Woesearchaeota archaeon]
MINFLNIKSSDQSMNITKDIEILDLALYIKKQKTLIITDTHIGYEEALNKQGVLVPRFQFKEIMQKLEKILKKVKPETIIINGDIKHEFGRISEQEWKLTLRLIDFLSRNCTKLILIRGNHDKILGPIAEKRNIEIAENILLENILITHGQNIPDISKNKNIDTIIIGHEHPAVGLKEDSRVEKFKCFLKGRYNDKTLIVQPSLSLVTEGTDVTKERLLSPFLKQKIDNFDCYIVADKVYKPFKLKKI